MDWKSRLTSSGTQTSTCTDSWPRHLAGTIESLLGKSLRSSANGPRASFLYRPAQIGPLSLEVARDFHEGLATREEGPITVSFLLDAVAEFALLKQCT